MLGSTYDSFYDIEDVEYLGNSHYWICDGVKDYTNYLVYFTEWQPYGNGTFDSGWYSFESSKQSSIKLYIKVLSHELGMV